MRRLAPALACALAAAFPVRARAAQVVAVLSSDSGHYRQALEGFQEAWGSPVPVVYVGRDLPAPGPDAIVAFGSRAALHPWPSSSLLEVCMAPGARLERRGDLVRVALLPAPDALMARMKRLLPRMRTVRVLWSSEFEEADVDEIAQAAGAQGVRVISERVSSPARLPEALRSFTRRADALWVMPDPALVNAESFATLREYARAARVPFLAPTEGLAQKGATATLAVPFRDVGRAAAAALKSALAGRDGTQTVHPEAVVLTVSESAARDVGLDLKTASGVDQVIP